MNEVTCEHGQLKRVCHVCNLEEHIANLETECKMLEGLLKEAMGALMGDFEVNPHHLLERIRAALNGG